MTLEERIKQMLEESTKQVEVEQTAEVVAEDEELSESYAVVDSSGKVASVHGAESAAKKKAAELSTKDNPHTVKFDRKAMIKFEATEEDLNEISQGLQQNLVAGRINQNRAAGATLNAAKKSATAIKPIAAAKPELFAQKKKDVDDAQTAKNTTQNKLGKTASLVTKRGGDYNAMAAKHVNANPMKESGVSDQVASLLEAEGLSEEFKVQAVTIFEAAVTDRVLQIQEELEAQYNEQLDEARAELEINIDGFLNEAVQSWADNNELAIQNNFKARLAESFIDGIQSLMAEHNIDLPEDKESALDIALDQVSQLEEAVVSTDSTIAQLQEQIDGLKAEKILESFKEKMAATEFDRFKQLTESVKYKDEGQYEKQLTVVLENFGKIVKPAAQQKEAIVEQVKATPATQQIVTESDSMINQFASYIAKQKR